jgi:hypothetical protein
MLFMVIERFRDNDMIPVYQRLRDQGRSIPEGLRYIESWVEPSFNRCFQLMECDDLTLFQRWIAGGRGLGVTFEIVPVVTRGDAGGGRALPDRLTHRFFTDRGRLERRERSAGPVRVDGALHDLAGAARVGRRSRHVLAALDAKLSGVGRSVRVAERASHRDIVRCETAFVVAGGGCALLASGRERERGCRRDEHEMTAGDGVRGGRTRVHDDA